MTLRYLPALSIDGHRASGAGGPDHPMRIVTRQVAGLEPGGWTEATRKDVGRYFDELAAGWNSRTWPERVAIVRDALDRGIGPVPAGAVALEVGSGTGGYSGVFAERFDRVIAVDLSLEMLRHAPAGPARRIRADASRLPLDSASVDAVLLVNAFLFPDEVVRVLRPNGVLLWVNSSAEQTPIYLSPEDLLAALPGAWTGTTSRAGDGLWCVLRREAKRH